MKLFIRRQSATRAGLATTRRFQFLLHLYHLFRDIYNSPSVLVKAKLLDNSFRLVQIQSQNLDPQRGILCQSAILLVSQEI